MFAKVFAGVAIVSMVALGSLWWANQNLRAKLTEEGNKNSRLSAELSTKDLTIDAYQEAAVIAERERLNAVERVHQMEELRTAIKECDFDEMDSATDSVTAAIRLLGQYRDCVSDEVRQSEDSQ